MKKFSVIFTVILMISLLSACVPTERTNIAIDPVMEEDKKGPVELDFTQLHNDTLDEFEGAGPYAFITDVDISGNNSSKVININAKCIDGVSKEDADHFLAACMRHISEAASVQYQRFGNADETTFGTLWNMYSLNATVTPDVEGAEPIESVNVPAGGEIPFSPNIEKFEAEWEKALEIYLRNENE